jgi:hypothetical protein
MSAAGGAGPAGAWYDDCYVSDFKNHCDANQLSPRAGRSFRPMNRFSKK